MRIVVLLALAGIAAAQSLTISFSEPPALASVAINNARLKGVAYFGATVCTSGAATKIQGSAVTQLAEKQAHINVIPAPMWISVISATQQKSISSRTVTATKWAMVAITVGGAALTSIKAGQKSANANTWGMITAGGASLSSGLTLFQSQAQAQYAAMQQAAQTVDASLISPTIEYPVPAGGCTTNLLFLGRAIANFTPVVAAIPND